MNKILSTKDVASILGMGINQTRELIKRKDFPKITIGKKWLIPEDALNDWINQSVYKTF